MADYDIDANMDMSTGHLGENNTEHGFYGNQSYDNMTDYYGNPVAEYLVLFYTVLWTFVAPIIFGLITVIGIVGNTLVIYVILRRPGMQTSTNFLLLNLAFSDLAFLIICVPLTAYKYAAATWPFGDVVCKMVSFFMYLTAYVTVYTLVAISVLRYVTVIHGMSTARYRTKTNIVITILLIWAVIGLVNVSSWFTHKVKVFDTQYTYCGMVESTIKPFFVCFFVFGYALPLVLICLVYIIVILHLNKARGSSGMDQTRERTLRASKVIILVVAIFMISWLPLHVIQMLSVFGTVPESEWYEVFRILCNCMAYGNSCANPIIYNFVSQDFKKGFRDIMCCSKKEGSRRRNQLNGVKITEQTPCM